MSDFEPFDTEAQDQAAADRKERDRLELVNELEDFKWLMGSKRGRRIVRRLLNITGVHRTSFHNSGSVTAFNEGQRNVGLKLMDMINSHCGDEYVKLLRGE